MGSARPLLQLHANMESTVSPVKVCKKCVCVCVCVEICVSNGSAARSDGVTGGSPACG